MPSVFQKRTLDQALRGCVGLGALVAASLACSSAARAQAMIDLTPQEIRTGADYVSADGRVVVGALGNRVGNFGFRWQAGALLMLRVADSTDTRPLGVSADGGVIVGRSFSGTTRAFKFADGVYTDLGTLGGSFAMATGVSADGRVIVGWSSLVSEVATQAFRYEGGVMTSIGTLGGTTSIAEAVSANGRVIVGSSQINGWGANAFRYENGVMTDIGRLGGGMASATLVSADGSVVAGWSNTGNGPDRAFRYANGVMTDLGGLPGATLPYSHARGMSADGSIIVGESFAADGGFHAFRYSDGVMADIGTLGGVHSSAAAISADGRVIVGRAFTAGNSAMHAFKHVDGVMTDLGTLGGMSSGATGVSANGRIIVGWSELDENISHAFVYRNAMLDLANTASAISKAASNTRNAMAQRMGALSLMMDYDCNAFGAHNLCLSFGGRYSELNSSNAEGAGLLTLAYRIAPNVRIGAFLDYRVSQRAPWGLNYRSDEPTFGGFIGYGAQDGLGLQAKLTAAVYHGGVTVTREASLANTEAGQGRASLNSWAVAGEIGWGFAFGDNWVATPYAGLRVMEAKLGAYSETLTDSVQFPLTYAGYGQRVTTLFGGLRVNGRLTDRVALFGSFGLEGDLSSKMDDVRGTSELPGMESFAIRNPAKANRVRPFGSLGIGYDVTPNQRIQAQVVLRGSPYGSQVSKTALLTYRIAF